MTERTPGVDPPAGDILRRAIGNTFWLFNGSIFVRALNLVRGVILARLLSPEDFGLSSLSLAIIGMSLIASDIGAANYLFFRPKEAKDHADTAFWINAAMVSAFAFALALAAPAIAAYYEHPDLVPVLRVATATFWSQGISTVHRNLLKNDLRFQALSLIDVAASLAAFGIGVGLALAGSGVWALVCCMLGGAIVTMLLQVSLARWRPSFRFRAASAHAILRFSGWYLGYSLMVTLILSLDSLMIPKVLGVEAVGIYGLAVYYAMLPFPLVASALGQAIYPELIRLHDHPDRFWETFHRASRMLVLAVAPIAAAGISAAPDLFHLAFGSKWNESVLPFRILLAFAMVRCLWIDPIASMGRFRGAFLLNTAVVAAAYAAIWVGMTRGVAGVAWAVLIVGSAWQVSTLLVASGSLRRTLAGLADAAPIVAAAAILVLAAEGIRHLVPGIRAGGPWIRLAATLPLVLGGYLLVFRRSIGGLAGLMFRSRGQDPAPI